MSQVAETSQAAIDQDLTAGFESLDRETHVDRLPVEGRLPDWLQGSLVRTAPAKWEVGSQTMNHWFDGFAMLHRFGIADGEVSYANRFLQTRAYRAAQEKGEIVYSEFATDPCRSLFGRAMSIFSPKLTDNANVNLVKLGERYISMTETPIAVEFDGDTLETAGVAYKAPGMLTTAHPHLDRASGGMLNYAAKLGPRNRYRFYLLRPGAGEPEVTAELPVSEPAYMHSFGLTERWLVLAEFPFVVNPISIPISGRPYIENYRWKPELGTKNHTGRPEIAARRPAPLRPTRSSASTTRTRTRRTVRSSSTPAPTPTRRSSRTSISTACGRASRPTAPSCAASGSISTRRRSPMSSSPRASSCPASTTAATASGPIATSGASTRSRAGSTGSSRRT